MLHQRLASGIVLATAALGILLIDSFLAPYYPILLVFTLAIAILGTRELLGLMGEVGRPRFSVTALSVAIVLLANWWPVEKPVQFFPTPEIIQAKQPPGTLFAYYFQILRAPAWQPVMFAFASMMLIAFLVEMARFREPGGIIVRLSQTMFAVSYLGLLPSFFVQIRFLPFSNTALLLLLAIFVPKCGDIGAYFTGSMIGKNKMTPRLSPKKTWEGLAGGLLASALTAVILSFAGPVFPGGIGEAIAFGIVVGMAGVLGDLAESLLKRDSGIKDASKSIPGMGGVLDVIDSVLFAAPVAFVWFWCRQPWNVPVTS